MTADSIKGVASDAINSLESSLLALSHRIHDNPELAFEEVMASEALGEAMNSASIPAVVGAFGLPTSVGAEVGEGSVEVVVCAEYDALPELGHACGHNIIAASAVGAVLAIAPHVDTLDITLRLLGTPAEEGGGGKIRLLEAGAFEDAHAALMLHPGPVDLPYMPTLATTRLAVTFTGRAAHASAFPERGINAADAATLSQTAIAMARQQFPPASRVHGIVTTAGSAPNVIPESSTLDYMIRARDRASLTFLEEKVVSCFQGAATATGCDVVIERSMPLYDALEVDMGLTAAYQANAERLGRHFRGMTDRVWRAAGSTDMGNVSQVVPSIHPMIGLGKDAGAVHSRDFAAAARASNGDKAVLEGATALAHTIVDLATSADLRDRLI